MKSFRVAAILCVRNEEMHIKRCIECLLQDGIEIIIIDHASEDSTVNIANQYVGKGVLDIIPMEFKGYFSLVDQLLLKEQIIKKIPHDWVIHIDADEWMHTLNNQPLVYALEQADLDNYNCVNFEELVFVPIGDENFLIDNYHHTMLNYYYLHFWNNFRMCAWKRDSRYSNVIGAGHVLSGENIKISPVKFVMRHYVCLSYSHFLEKFKNRIFASDELANNWHGDREIIKHKLNWLQSSQSLHTLPHWNTNQFDFSKPFKQNFWKWNNGS